MPQVVRNISTSIPIAAAPVARIEAANSLSTVPEKSTMDMRSAFAFSGTCAAGALGWGAGVAA
jgi:hypothetical protein